MKGQAEAVRMEEADIPAMDRVDHGLLGWRRERPDIDSSGKNVVGRIIHLHDIILRNANRSLEPYGLKFPAYGVLATLRSVGTPYRMSPGELRHSLLYSSGGLSNLLSRLEDQGLVRRLQAVGDRRGVIVELTARGVALADRTMVDYAASELRILDALSPADRTTMASMLRRLILDSGADEAPE
jgi:DNA-binding MarR family transcriptional regulator